MSTWLCGLRGPGVRVFEGEWEEAGEKVCSIAFQALSPPTISGRIEMSDHQGCSWRATDFVAELADHLADGWVAILMEVGHEQSRYLVGYAVAVNSAGETVTVDLDSIHALAERLGEHVTRVEGRYVVAALWEGDVSGPREWGL